MLQNNQLDKDVKKTLTVIFYTDNAREKINIDKNIINAKDYLNNNMAQEIKHWQQIKRVQTLNCKIMRKILKNLLRSYLQTHTKTTS